jgi:GTP-binding protein LepA
MAGALRRTLIAASLGGTSPLDVGVDLGEGFICRDIWSWVVERLAHFLPHVSLPLRIALVDRRQDTVPLGFGKGIGGRLPFSGFTARAVMLGSLSKGENRLGGEGAQARGQEDAKFVYRSPDLRIRLACLWKLVTAKCYGGDISRERKLLDKRKDGRSGCANMAL